MEEDEFEVLHQELAERLDLIQRLLQAGDSAEIGRQLHSIKGLAKAYGLDQFADHVHALEETPGRYADVIYMTGQLDRLFIDLEESQAA